MNISAREWSAQYDALKKKIASKRINSHGFSGEEIRSIQNAISKLDQDLQIMNRDMLQYEIASSEIARRQVLITNLKNQDFRPQSPAHKFGIDSPNTNGNKGTYNPMNNTTDQGLIQRQKDIIGLQDEMIADIEKGVGRLHEKAVTIGEEAKMSVRLLDNLDSNVELATTALREETAHAMEIREKGKVCYMYICIAIECVILLIMIILAFVG